MLEKYKDRFNKEYNREDDVFILDFSIKENTMSKHINEKIEQFIKDASENNLSPVVIEFAKIMMNNTDKDLKKYKKNHKSMGIGLFVKDEYLVKYFKLQNKIVKILKDKENKRAWDYLNDKEEAEKHNFIDENDYKPQGSKFGMKIPKQTPEMVTKWAEMAYPNIAYEEWEKNFNILMLRGNLSDV